MSDSVSPIPYTGNKNCIQDTILSVMPPHKTYLEACMGSAEIFLRKPRAEKEMINDYNGDLVKFFRVLQNSEKLSYLIGRLYLSFNSEQIFRENKQLLQTIPNILDDIEHFVYTVEDYSWEDIKEVVAFFENQVFSFSSTGKTIAIAKRDMTKKFTRLIAACARLRDAIILHRDFRDAIRYAVGEDTFVLLDPPYRGTEACYQKSSFNGQTHQELFDFVYTVHKQYEGKCKFLITYNNDPVIQSLADACGFDTFVQPRLHNMRQGSDPGAVFEELLIANYDMKAQAEENERALFHQIKQLTLFDFNPDY